MLEAPSLATSLVCKIQDSFAACLAREGVQGGLEVAANAAI